MTMTGTLPWPTSAPTHRQEPHPWLVLYDPTGDFQSRRLRGADIELSCGCWPDGMIVWHAGRGEVRIWRLGKWDSLTPKKGERDRA